MLKIYTGPTYPLQMVLELACAAQRANRDYVKTLEAVFSTEETGQAELMAYKHPNRTLMLVALGEDKTTYTDPKTMPQLISTNLDDQELATEIQKYFHFEQKNKISFLDIGKYLIYFPQLLALQWVYPAWLKA